MYVIHYGVKVYQELIQTWNGEGHGTWVFGFLGFIGVVHGGGGHVWGRSYQNGVYVGTGDNGGVVNVVGGVVYEGRLGTGRRPHGIQRGRG